MRWRSSAAHTPLPSARLARRARPVCERRSHAAASVTAMMSGAREWPAALAEQRGAHRAAADAE